MTNPAVFDPDANKHVLMSKIVVLVPVLFFIFFKVSWIVWLGIAGGIIAGFIVTAKDRSLTSKRKVWMHSGWTVSLVALGYAGIATYSRYTSMLDGDPTPQAWTGGIEIGMKLCGLALLPAIFAVWSRKS